MGTWKENSWKCESDQFLGVVDEVSDQVLEGRVLNGEGLGPTVCGSAGESLGSEVGLEHLDPLDRGLGSDGGDLLGRNRLFEDELEARAGLREDLADLLLLGLGGTIGGGGRGTLRAGAEDMTGG